MGISLKSATKLGKSIVSGDINDAFNSVRGGSSGVSALTGNPWVMVGSALLDTGMSIYSANSANKHAKRMAEQQRAWAKMMSDTAHQREVADLKKSGLNPILSAMNGNGASTPGSGIADTYAIQPSDLASSAKAKMMADLEEKNLRQQLQKNIADIQNQTRDSIAYANSQKWQAAEAKTASMLNAIELLAKKATFNGSVNATNARNRLSVTNDDFDNSVAGQLIKQVPKAASAIGDTITLGGASALRGHSAKSVDKVRPRGYNYYDKSGKYTGSREIVY